MRSISLPLLYRITLLLLIVAWLPRESAGQQLDKEDEPVRPSIRSTTQMNPRGADVVEPARVLKVSVHEDGSSDTTVVGIAKVPDPRRNEVGATVNTDLVTGTLVRLGGAWIYDDQGLRQSVSFGSDGSRELLVFRPGKHDDVVSLQGVQPLVRTIGDIVVFDLRDLYDASTLNPITGGSAGTTEGHPRLSLLRMVSTYPGGEAVELAVVLAPVAKPQPPLAAIRFERRDTTIIRANPTYVVRQIVQNEVRDESDWTAAFALESGFGQSRLSTEIPATLRPPFSSSGHSGTMYIDGTIYLKRSDSRWALRMLGTSAVTGTDPTPISHHQVAVYADARFEQGEKTFVLAQLSGEMTDKQYQEFDWNSADYAGAFLVGVGHHTYSDGLSERLRLELMAGLRMGENRKIGVMETRDRSRGIGPQIILAGEFTQLLGRGFELLTGSEARGYTIQGRGHRDDGFSEKGLLLQGDVRVGKAFLGVGTYAGITVMSLFKEANFKEGGHYSENKLLIAPGISFQTHL